ncbi:hypothetical protein BS78_08G141900 [Paspalum vaginatum]|nr:hypothetical protein BS78_08G141900 [Paspalum vaginatum]
MKEFSRRCLDDGWAAFDGAFSAECFALERFRQSQEDCIAKLKLALQIAETEIAARRARDGARKGARKKATRDEVEEGEGDPAACCSVTVELASSKNHLQQHGYASNPPSTLRSSPMPLPFVKRNCSRCLAAVLPRERVLFQFSLTEHFFLWIDAYICGAGDA